MRFGYRSKLKNLLSQQWDEHIILRVTDFFI